MAKSTRTGRATPCNSQIRTHFVQHATTNRGQQRTTVEHQFAIDQLAGLNDTELERLLAALAVVRNAIAAAPDDAGPPPARRTPPRLRRS